MWTPWRAKWSNHFTVKKFVPDGLAAMWRTASLGACLTLWGFAETAPTVTNIHAIHHDGQTFITWTDAAGGSAGEIYRYDLYRSTSGPITSLASATLVERAIYNNSGQLIGPKPFSQATRQDPAQRMSKIQDGGSSLPVWSGLAVYTARVPQAAYYAVITRDTRELLQPSTLSAGNNALQKMVVESPAPIRPVLQVPSSDPSRSPNCCAISGKQNLPLCLRLHGSGGRQAPLGDYWAYWGDSTMGHQDGIQSAFSIYEDQGRGISSGGRQLILTPQDAVWSLNGNFQSETFWYGYKDIPMSATDPTPHIYPITQAKLASILPWVINHYGADPNRIYGSGQSMGGFGQVTWSLRQPNLFAAMFLRIPLLGSWLRAPSLIDVSPRGAPSTVKTANDTLPDGTLYNDATNTPAWVARDCSRNLPYLSWSSGRNDRGVENHGMWASAVQMANALRHCHYGFSFVWGNGVHDSATANLENTLLAQYGVAFARNISYPAFSNFSLDNNYGNGTSTDGDPSGCVNCGWTWNVTSDTATSWSCSFTNPGVTTRATTDVTLRNAQMFKPNPGTAVTWSTSTGYQGKVVADTYGLVTVTGIELIAGTPTTLTIH